MAEVLPDFETVWTRPLRTEVHFLPSPAGFELGKGGLSIDDSDMGTYFRPHMGEQLLVGGMEPECDELVWVPDPDEFDRNATNDIWQAQVLRVARRLPTLTVPLKPVGLAALYDVTPDWRPIYDRTSLPGFYVAIGTSGNQFKNAPVVGRLMAELVIVSENGLNHDESPYVLACPLTGYDVDLRHYSRLRELGVARNVIG
jgi:sarcosine oxidase, subunit beta